MLFLYVNIEGSSEQVRRSSIYIYFTAMWSQPIPEAVEKQERGEEQLIKLYNYSYCTEKVAIRADR